MSDPLELTPEEARLPEDAISDAPAAADEMRPEEQLLDQLGVQVADEEAQLAELPPPPEPGNMQVLQKLSSPPFPRSGFPLLGIMASVYEHVTSVVSRMKSPS